MHIRNAPDHAGNLEIARRLVREADIRGVGQIAVDRVVEIVGNGVIENDMRNNIGPIEEHQLLFIHSGALHVWEWPHNLRVWVASW